MFFGDSVEISNMEKMFDVFEESIKTLYDIKPRPYFELFFETADNILSGELLKTYDDETDEKLLHIYSRLTDVDFAPEDIRKALQSLIIRGYKEEGIVQDLTPDTLGFLIAYLISRLTKETNISILDPLAGSGNMLISIENHLNINCNLFAIENDKLKVLPKLNLKVSGDEDIIINGLGFIKIVKEAKVVVYTLDEKMISKRKKMI